MLLMAGIGVLRGMQWSLNFLLATGGVTMLVALGRPLYRVAVYRIGAQEILCRLIPWYQATPLAASVLFPLIGIAFIAQGRESDTPFWVLYGGYFIFIMGCCWDCGMASCTFHPGGGRIGHHTDNVVFRAAGEECAPVSRLRSEASWASIPELPTAMTLSAARWFPPVAAPPTSVDP